MSRECAIFDLDNCLFDDEHRMHLIDFSTSDMNERYRAYHRAAIHDLAKNVDVLHRNLARGRLPLFFTARPQEMREITQDALWNHFRLSPILGSCELYMRPDISFVPTVGLKRQMLIAWIERNMHSGRRIVRAYDDRPDIVEMYKANGIPLAQVLKIHDVCAYTPREEKRNG